MTERALNKLVASNSLNANRNLMRQLEESGETNRVLYYTLRTECERIVKRYPSLR
jgi:hypothetical protein